MKQGQLEPWSIHPFFTIAVDHTCVDKKTKDFSATWNNLEQRLLVRRAFRQLFQKHSMYEIAITNTPSRVHGYFLSLESK